MPDKRMPPFPFRFGQSMQEAQTGEKAKEDFESLVQSLLEWYTEVFIMHGERPEVGGADPLRGYMRWLRRKRARAAEPGPHGRQWPSAQTPHIQGACWCGVLPGSEGKGLAQYRAVQDGDGVLRLPHDPDSEPEDVVDETTPLRELLNGTSALFDVPEASTCEHGHRRESCMGGRGR
jgi:hypothetical protein